MEKMICVSFEAESVSYLVCARPGIDKPLQPKTGNYWEGNENADAPSISLEFVLKSAGLIEQMRRGRLKPRKSN